MKSKILYSGNFLILVYLGLLFNVGCKQKGKTIAEKVVVAQPEELAPTTSEIIRYTLAEIADDGRLDSFHLKNIEIVSAWYQNVDYKTIWTTEGKWLPAGDSLYHFINAARRHGLFPEHYNSIRLTQMHTLTYDSIQKENALNASLWAQSDLLLTSAFIQAVKDLKVGRLTADSILVRDTSLSLSFFQKQFENFSRTNSSSFVAGLEPGHSRYRRLKEALQLFLTGADFKTYAYVNIKDTIQLPALVGRRLREEDSLNFTSSDSFTLAAAIKKYQIAKGIKADGKIGPQLVAVLNNTDADKFAQIAITLDRYKQLPSLPAEYIWVNIPSYRLTLMKDDVEVLTSKVVVGKPYTRTPVLTSAISDMITYPQWHIPNSIIKKEILPALKKDAGYLARRGYSLSDWKGNIIDPYTVDWSQYKDGVPYRVIQGSGDDNALGVLKFNFPNKYSVYLHDTNQRYLFSKEKRALSHGCVRVESWAELAYFLLERDSAEPNAIPADSLRTWLALKEKHVLPLRKRMPLYIRYFACDADEEGNVVFYEDIYGDDRKLKALLLAQTNGL